MLFVERSNRTERLLDGLATRLMAPGTSPLTPSRVVVQGPGMERWLAQSLAERSGVCANTEFLFPRQLLEEVFSVLPGEEAELRGEAWSVGRLTWSIARLLAEGREDPDFESLTRHLKAADGDWRLVQLAGQIATLFDGYITFRPEWVRDWSRAKHLPSASEERWQARLIRDLTAELGPGHVADRAGVFLARPASAWVETLTTHFSSQVEIFAVTTLPPLYLSVIDRLAECLDVHLSVLSPSEGYFADLWKEVRDGDLAEGRASEEGRGGGLFDAGPATPAARLLAGLGRLGGDFQRCLTDQVSGSEVELDLFESSLLGRDASSSSLLARVQADLLELDPYVDFGDRDALAADPARVVGAADDSISVHLCHGPRRELEVVRELLRDAFERDPSLVPEDVIVMAPRIDEIAPEIEAIFGTRPGEEGHSIPFRIADRGALKRSPVAEAFRSLLDLLGSRMGRSEWVDWLTRAPARERFDLSEEEIERVAVWAEGAGIRFGLDEAHREGLGLAPERRHTLASGLDRLALAHAVGASAEVFEQLAPAPLDPFSDASVLGALGDFESMLQSAREAASRPKKVSDWCDWLTGLLASSCAQADGNAEEHTSIRALLQELQRDVRAAGFEEPIPFEAIREQVSDALGSTPAPQAFLAGGVTFCELVPLRAIPFKVIAILGMSDSAFPRSRPALGFDLMARSPRAGDRSARNDDRALFLEALLSARERLILTVPGRDMRDGSNLPPSIVVSELLDAIEGSFVCEPGKGKAVSIRDRLVIEHPLQSYSGRYFEGTAALGLVGRDAEAFAGAEVRQAAIESGGGEERRFLLDALRAGGEGSATPTGSTGPLHLSLDVLIERVMRSTRTYARDVLGLRLPRINDVVGDLDPDRLEPLDQYALGSAFLDELLGGVPSEEATEHLRSRSAVPSGVPGELAARSVSREAHEIMRLGSGHYSHPALPDLEFSIDLEPEGLGTCVLSGRLDCLFEQARVVSTFGRVNRRGEFEVWIRHLFLCAAAEAGHTLPTRSVLIGRPESGNSSDQVIAFKPVPDAREHLSLLFAWAWASEEMPLPFFPKTSRVFAKHVQKDQLEMAWRNANKEYFGGDGYGPMPESEEGLEHARVWEGVSPLESDPALALKFHFGELAETFFRPLFEAREAGSS